MTKTAAIIGAGFGGLALAMRLQSAGISTTIIEARDKPGGRGYYWEKDGFTFDGGPTVITDPPCLEELWSLSGHKMSDDVELMPVFPFYRLNWPDGTNFDYSNDAPGLKAEIEKPVRGAIATVDAAKLFGYALTAGEAPIKGGSGRRFHRVAKPDGSTAMLCIYDDARPENLGYGRLGHALFAAGINVPQVLAEDTDAGVLVMEDLGDTDLCTLTQQPTFPWPAVASALEQLGHLHRLGAEAVQTAGVPLMEPFGDKLYTWERQYFTDNVLAGRKLDRDLQNEMATLAKELSGRPQVLVHRDFQSQNIMVRDGSAWLVDLQGLRHGCMFYDYASLAFDPYLKRNDMDLWRIEIEDHAREVSGWKGSSDEFSHYFHVAATQRLLQACGAYAFLGRKQGRADFLAHLPQGLRNLTIAASLCGKRRIARLAEELAGAPAKVSR